MIYVVLYIKLNVIYAHTWTYLLLNHRVHGGVMDR